MLYDEVTLYVNGAIATTGQEQSVRVMAMIVWCSAEADGHETTLVTCQGQLWETNIE